MSTCCGPAIVARPNEEESNCGFVPVRIFRLLVGYCTRRKHNGCQDQEDRRASAHFNFLTLVEFQPSKITNGLQFYRTGRRTGASRPPPTFNFSDCVPTPSPCY